MSDILTVFATTLALIAMSNAFQNGHTIFGIVALTLASAGAYKYVISAWRESHGKGNK